MFRQTALATSLLLATSAADAATLGVPFFPGDGNSNENFVIDTFEDVNGGVDIEIGIKAKERFIGELPFSGPNRYQALTGESELGLPIWNFDLSIDLGQETFQAYDAYLTLDFYPDIGNTTNLSFAWIDNPFVPGAPVQFDETISLFQTSQNIGFSFLQGLPNAQPFDPFATGEYQLGLSIFAEGATDFNNPIASATAFVDVAPIPLPAGAWLLLSGLGVLAFTRRRKQA